MTHPALRHVPTPNWAALAWSLPYGWYEPPPPPDPSWLPPPGHYHVDPARSSVRAQVRGRRGWRAGTGGVTGSLHCTPRSATVDLAVEAAGLRSGEPDRDRTLRDLLDPPSFPLLRLTTTDLAAAYGAWVLLGELSLRGRAAPVALRLDGVQRQPDGTITVGLRGVLERRASGLRRRVALELDLVATLEPVSSAQPWTAAVVPLLACLTVGIRTAAA